jgi:hypothetical protein
MTQAKIRIMPARQSGLNAVPAYTGPQGSAAAFVQGAPVKLSSGDLVAVSTTASLGASSGLSAVDKSSTANVVGIAMGTAVASVTTDIVVAKFTEGMEFVGNLIHNAASSAKVSKVGSTVYLGKVTAETHWGWSLTAPGASSASYVTGIITGFVDAASTVNGRVTVAINTGGAFAL